MLHFFTLISSHRQIWLNKSPKFGEKALIYHIYKVQSFNNPSSLFLATHWKPKYRNLEKIYLFFFFSLTSGDGWKPPKNHFIFGIFRIQIFSFWRNLANFLIKRLRNAQFVFIVRLIQVPKSRSRLAGRPDGRTDGRTGRSIHQLKGVKVGAFPTCRSVTGWGGQPKLWKTWTGRPIIWGVGF
jgi:hypothetical protein